ncbi:DUF7315 family membrane protein [Halobaculum magnesiiphilum]|uniref:DUF7315 family membrane protein n=1 Tax=Halobaculum magnesiiphilum TaxID=1017351 RepID=UPI001CED0115|nr:hypothetical protein [Halobaculum magnesiiphilum]
MSDTSREGDAAADDGPPGTTASADGATAGGDASEPDGPAASGEGRARDVVVPIAVYKRVTAYSTLAAVVTVVLGFVMLDAATLNVSLTRQLVVGVFGAVGVVPSETLLTALFSLAGLGLIAFGAGVYVLGSRFRAPGMTGENGNSQDDDPEV